ncbi:MAG: hypothetical protein ACOX30_03060 [Dethiobacteria bacterium]|jgi:uncharacterized protein YnzC (UPF0291/DUF896 family)
MTNSVVPFPGFEELKAAVNKLCAELSMLQLEHDELLYVECKNIETAYMLAIGGLEYKAYEVECAILRLKRKIELIRAKKNRQEKVVLSEIEERLDAEFAQYQERLNEQIARMNAALERKKSTPLSEKETRELKKLYRSIVRSLHPDINPDQDQVKRQLFDNAVVAYKNGDLDGLRAISVMVAGSTLPGEPTSSTSQLLKEKERLSKLLQGLKEKIAALKSEYPYTEKSLLLDPEQVQARKARLKSRIEELNLNLAAYKAKIEEMLG